MPSVSSEKHGLNPKLYQPDFLEEKLHSYLTLPLSERRPEDLAEIDVQFTLTFHYFVNDLHIGHIDPYKKLGQKWNRNGRQLDLATYIARTLTPKSRLKLKNEILSLAPQHAAYKVLLKNLAFYRKIRQQGGWEKVPGSDKSTLDD